MKALQMTAPDTLEFTMLPQPEPGAGEVLLKIRATTICTSDIHDLAENPFGLPLPIVLGHEATGEVVATGEQVKNIQPGMLVGIHPVISCGHCRECQAGYGHLCANMGHSGFDRNGTFAEYMVHPANRVFPLPASISLVTGCLLEPVCVCLQALSRAGTIKGQSVMITGDGPFGNILARLAVHQGASAVFIKGGKPSRFIPYKNVQVVQEGKDPEVDIAVLAVSSPAALQACVAAVKPRGRIVVFSLLSQPVPIDLFKLHIKEISLTGACNDENKVSEALTCLQDATLQLQELITHTFTFNEWQQAFQLAKERPAGVLKIALLPV